MSRLTNLLNYQSRTRRAGHTSLMIEGVHYNKRGLILFASMQHAQQAFRETLDRVELGELENVRPDFSRLRIGQVQFQSIGILGKIEELFRGFDPDNMPPVIVDHFAMDLLIREHNKQMEKMIGAKA